MNLGNIYGVVAFAPNAEENLCRVVHALYGAEHSEAADLVGPRAFDVELDARCAGTWRAAERWASAVARKAVAGDESAARDSESSREADGGTAASSEAAFYPMESETASDPEYPGDLDDIEAGLAELYARVVGAARSASPRAFRAAAATIWVLCLPNEQFDALDGGALLDAHGRALLQAGTGTALVVDADVCELPQMSSALVLGARYLAESDERTHLRRRLICPRGKRDAHGMLGAAVRGALAAAWRDAAARVLDAWERAVADEATVRAGGMTSPWRRAHGRVSFDPRESASVIAEQTGETLDAFSSMALVEAALGPVATFIREQGDFAVTSDDLVRRASWNDKLAVDVMRGDMTMARDGANALARATGALPLPTACSVEDGALAEVEKRAWSSRPFDEPLAQAVLRERQQLELIIEGYGIEALEPAVPRVAELVLEELDAKLALIVDVDDEGESYTLLHTTIPPVVAVAGDGAC